MTPRSRTAVEGKAMLKPNANCPVLAGISRISDLTQDIQRTMRKLRRDLDRCKTCPAGPQCPVLQEYQALIHEAITDVLAELETGN